MGFFCYYFIKKIIFILVLLLNLEKNGWLYDLVISEFVRKNRGCGG